MGLACHGRPSFDGSGARGCPPFASLVWLSVVPSLQPVLCQGLRRRWGASSCHGDTRAEHGSESRGTALRCRASLGQQGCSCLRPAVQAGESRAQQRVTPEYPTPLSSARRGTLRREELPPTPRGAQSRGQRRCELTAKAGATLHIVLCTEGRCWLRHAGSAGCLHVIVPLSNTPCHIQLLGTQPGALSPSFTLPDCTRLLRGCARLCLQLGIRTTFCSQPGTQGKRP